MPSPVMRLVVTALLLFAFAGVAYAQEDHAKKDEDPMAVPRILGVDPDKLVSLTQEQRKYAEALGEEVVCLCGTCPRHTITACNCGWAHTHKRMLQVALLEGKTAEEIKSAYMKAYGAKAFPTPPGKWGTLTWIIPYAAAGTFLVAFILFGLRMRRRHAATGAVSAAAEQTPGTAGTDDEDRAILDRELEDLD